MRLERERMIVGRECSQCECERQVLYFEDGSYIEYCPCCGYEELFEEEDERAEELR